MSKYESNLLKRYHVIFLPFLELIQKSIETELCEQINVNKYHVTSFK